MDVLECILYQEMMYWYYQKILYKVYTKLFILILNDNCVKTIYSHLAIVTDMGGDEWLFFFLVFTNFSLFCLFIITKSCKILHDLTNSK